MRVVTEPALLLNGHRLTHGLLPDFILKLKMSTSIHETVIVTSSRSFEILGQVGKSGVTDYVT